MPNNAPWTSGKIWSAVVAGLVPLLVSFFLGFLFPVDGWYKCLNKPCFTPPGWVFGLVWSILYPLIGVAMVAACYDTDNTWTWILPIMNIVIGLLFSPLMMGMRSIALGALITVTCLFIGIGLMVQYPLANKSYLAMYLTIPYVLWLCLASAIVLWMLWKNCDSKIKECAKQPRSCGKLKFPKPCSLPEKSETCNSKLPKLPCPTTPCASM